MLINFILAMSILSTLTVTAVPSFSKLLSKNNAYVTVKMIDRAIRYASSIAVTNDILVNVTNTINNGVNEIIISDSNRTLKKIALLQVKDLYWYGFGDVDEINILPTGMTFNNGHFTFRVKRHFCKIYINNALKISRECREIGD